jgi:hypothetical protein
MGIMLDSGVCMVGIYHIACLLITGSIIESGIISDKSRRPHYFKQYRFFIHPEKNYRTNSAEKQPCPLLIFGLAFVKFAFLA